MKEDSEEQQTDLWNPSTRMQETTLDARSIEGQRSGTLICSICEDKILQRPFDRIRMIPARVSEQLCYQNRPGYTVREAAKNGCRICKIIWEDVSIMQSEEALLSGPGIDCRVRSDLKYFQLICVIFSFSMDKKLFECTIQLQRASGKSSFCF